MNGDPPIDNATAADDQAGPLLENLLDDLRDRFMALFPGMDLDSVEITYAIAEVARRIAVDMLESPEFAHRLVTFIKAYKLTLFRSLEFQGAFETKFDEMLQYDEFKARVGEIASNMVGQNTSLLLESDEFRAKVLEIAWPDLKEDPCHDTLDRLAKAAFHTDRAFFEVLVESDEFKRAVRFEVDRVRAGSMKALDDFKPTPITDPADVKDDEEDMKRLRVASKAIHDACDDPADVEEEIIEIDEAGNVTPVESTVHAKPDDTNPMPIVRSKKWEYPGGVSRDVP
jgi:hypothetical protein